MSTIEFKLTDTYNGRVVTGSTTLEGEHIHAYLEAFTAFLLMIGFDRQIVNRYLPEDV